MEIEEESEQNLIFEICAAVLSGKPMAIKESVRILQQVDLKITIVSQNHLDKQGIECIKYLLKNDSNRTGDRQISFEPEEHLQDIWNEIGQKVYCWGCVGGRIAG